MKNYEKHKTNEPRDSEDPRRNASSAADYESEGFAVDASLYSLLLPRGVCLATRRRASEGATQQGPSPPGHSPVSAQLPKDGTNLAALLLGAGQTYVENGDGERAKECGLQALDLCAPSVPSLELAECLDLLGSAHKVLDEPGPAETYWLRAQYVREQLGDHLGAARCSCKLGTLRMAAGDLHGARRELKRSLQLSASSVPGAVRARALEQLCPVERRLGDPAAALHCLTEALRIREALGDTELISRNHYQLANIHLAQGQLTEAIAHYKQCLELFDERGDQEALALAYNNLAVAQMHRGDYRSSTRNFERARDLYTEIGESRRYAWTLGNLGLLCSYRGEAEESQRLLLECLRRLELVGDGAGQAIFMNNLGLVYRIAGKYEQAVDWARRSMQLVDELGHVEGATQPRINLALSLLALGDIDAAETLADEVTALSVESKLGGIRSEARLLQASVALARGLPDRALEHASEAESLAQEGDHPRQRAESLRVRGEALLRTGRIEEARGALLKAHEDFRSLKDLYLLSQCRSLLGELFLEASASEAAARHLRQAAEFFRRVGNATLEWNALTLLGRAEWSLSRAQALDTLASAVELARRNGLDTQVEKALAVRSELEQSPKASGREDRNLTMFQEVARILGTDADGGQALSKVAEYLQDQFSLTFVEFLRSGRETTTRWKTNEELYALEALIHTARRTNKAHFRWDDVDVSEDRRPYVATIPIPGPGPETELFLAFRGDEPSSPDAAPGNPPNLLRVLEALGAWLALLRSSAPAATATSAPSEPSVQETTATVGPAFEGMVGTSREMQQIYDSIRRVASSDASVFVHGESGTGKELVARALHNTSPRRTGPFVAISCPSIPRELIEAELFGHEKGAFTGATTHRPGQVELADKGTLFLDEIGDMDLATQTKLLRFLQEREFTRVGGRTPIRVDIRIVGATSRRLEDEIAAGRFREDLFYRINVVPIEIPPLRRRKSDTVELVRHFLHEFAVRKECAPISIEERAVELLTAYNWPGNIRELRNTIEYLVAVGSGNPIRVEDLPAKLRAAAVDEEEHESEVAASSVLRPGETLEARIMSVEGAIIRKTLEECDWNQSLAARLIGLKEPTMRYKMRRYGIRKGGRGVDSRKRNAPSPPTR